MSRKCVLVLERLLVVSNSREEVLQSSLRIRLLYCTKGGRLYII